MEEPPPTSSMGRAKRSSERVVRCGRAQGSLRVDTQIRPYGGNGGLAWIVRLLRTGTSPATVFY